MFYINCGEYLGSGTDCPHCGKSAGVDVWSLDFPKAGGYYWADIEGEGIKPAIVIIYDFSPPTIMLLGSGVTYQRHATQDWWWCKMKIPVRTQKEII
jgi:hypothetical protein